MVHERQFGHFDIGPGYISLVAMSHPAGVHMELSRSKRQVATWVTGSRRQNFALHSRSVASSRSYAQA